LYWKGLCQLALADAKGAVESLSRSLRSSGPDALTSLALARALHAAGRSAEARWELERALWLGARPPEDLDALREVGLKPPPWATERPR
jgi:Flp pilus assembly protein TadD